MIKITNEIFDSPLSDYENFRDNQHTAYTPDYEELGYYDPSREEMEELTEYAMNYIANGLKINKLNGSIDFDYVDFGDRKISFRIEYYKNPNRSIGKGNFSTTIDFEDSRSESVEDAKYVIANRADEFIANFKSSIKR